MEKVFFSYFFTFVSTLATRSCLVVTWTIERTVEKCWLWKKRTGFGLFLWFSSVFLGHFLAYFLLSHMPGALFEGSSLHCSMSSSFSLILKDSIPS